jgi:lysophospholipid acyltransferase (LPLAT)-like uncharacterized protein
MARISVARAAAPLSFLGAGYLRLVRATTRIDRVGASLPADGGPVIYAFWHQHLVMMPWVQFRPPTVVPISRSEDGEVTTRIFARLQVRPVRGSSSRGGAAAARGLIRAAAEGYDMGITLDGPRGPARVVQAGATWIARATGRPLLPVAYTCTHHRLLGTWDRMLLPLPGGRGVFAYEELLWIDHDARPDDLSAADRELAERLERAERRALAAV